MILVNLTTTSTRLDLCSATLWSLVNQNIDREYIVNLWVSKDAYLSDNGITETPQFVHKINIVKNIVRIRYTDNIGPYRKLIPCIRETSDEDIIVYADDDVVYGQNWLSLLILDFESSNREMVIASRVRVFEKNIFGVNKGYSFSKIVYDGKVLSSDFIITGVGGVVISRKFFSDELIMNDDFIFIAPKTDDVWFTKIINISNISVKVCVEALDECYELSHDKYSLCSQNTTRKNYSGLYSKLDSLWGRLISYFGFCSNNNDLAKKKVDEYFENNKVLGE